MPRVAHLLGPAEVPHRVVITVLDNGQGHAGCRAPGCDWQRVDILPWISHEHGLTHVEQHLTAAQRTTWKPMHKHGYQPTHGGAA